MNPYSTHQTSNLYVYILLLSLATFAQNVSSSNINQLGDSLPRVTVGNGNICSDIFDNSQCMFIHKALDVLIHKYEAKLKDSERRLEKKLKDSQLESENKIRAIQVESMQQIKEISAIFQDRFDLKHVEMDRKYKRLERQLLRNQNGQTTEQIISSHNSLTNFSTLSHDEESRAEKMWSQQFIPFLRPIARILMLRDKKYRILTFCNKTESYLTVLQQNNAEAC